MHTSPSHLIPSRPTYHACSCSSVMQRNAKTRPDQTRASTTSYVRRRGEGREEDRARDLLLRITFPRRTWAGLGWAGMGWAGTIAYYRVHERKESFTKERKKHHVLCAATYKYSACIQHPNTCAREGDWHPLLSCPLHATPRHAIVIYVRTQWTASIVPVPSLVHTYTPTYLHAYIHSLAVHKHKHKAHTAHPPRSWSRSSYRGRKNPRR